MGKFILGLSSSLMFFSFLVFGVCVSEITYASFVIFFVYFLSLSL